MHLLTGSLGHLMVIVSFVSALASSLAYLGSILTKDSIREKGWRYNGRFFFIMHGIGVLSILSVLFVIIGNNYFEYHYAWSHSSKYLPFYYKIAAFWEGQEGSFLLWAFWHVVIGLFIIYSSRSWEGHVMFVFSLVQAFLLSMILGVIILGHRFGSSPFLLLRDVLHDPVFKLNPDFIPKDGTGLNPLLQNYWMVIHPPTLFLGFALTIVPFSYGIAALLKKQYKAWIKQVMPWTILTTGILGLGILMGAYWAYETLNFGGYWNWDPVENAIYVPWLVVVASLHSMVISNKKGTSLRLSFVLVISAFLLILYSTFLTRSGILGNTSVHSFTDLGLSGQLLLYFLVFTVGSILILALRWKQIPAGKGEVSSYSAEFWIVIGIITLCLAGFQVIIPTSIPVYNAILNGVGIKSNLALPADQLTFYSRFQIWFAFAIAILSGTAQILWWKKVNRKNLFNEFSIPVIITLAASIIIMLVFHIVNISYMLLVTAGLYSIISNGRILIKVMSARTSFSGGTLSHTGIALMIIGILTSSGYSKVVSLNNTGLLYSRNFPDEINKENLLLFLHESRQMGEYRLTYEGKKIRARELSGYIDKSSVITTADPHIVIVSKDIIEAGLIKAKKGDTLEINPENTYYEILYESRDGNSFRLYPRLQENKAMGNVVSPSIRKTLLGDIYTHVTVVANDERDWSAPYEQEVKLGDTFIIKDQVVKFTRMEGMNEVNGIKLSAKDVAVKAHLEMQSKDMFSSLEPVYLIQGNRVAQLPAENTDWGIKLSIIKISPEKNSFTFEISTSEKDYVILKAVSKPMINLLWLGTLVLMTGTGISLTRRFRESQDKNQ
jgi:cytochrome c-type biogenesis protein CcmF